MAESALGRLSERESLLPDELLQAAIHEAGYDIANLREH